MFGYRTDAMPEAGPDYATFALPNERAPLGGMGGMMGAEGRPADWVVYFGVSDAAAAVAAAERGGGSVLVRDFTVRTAVWQGSAIPTVRRSG